MAFIAMPSEVGLASICDVAVGVEGALIGLMETIIGSDSGHDKPLCNYAYG